MCSLPVPGSPSRTSGRVSLEGQLHLLDHAEHGTRMGDDGADPKPLPQFRPQVRELGVQLRKRRGPGLNRRVFDLAGEDQNAIDLSGVIQQGNVPERLGDGISALPGQERWGKGRLSFKHPRRRAQASQKRPDGLRIAFGGVFASGTDDQGRIPTCQPLEALVEEQHLAVPADERHRRRHSGQPAIESRLDSGFGHLSIISCHGEQTTLRAVPASAP